MVSSRILTYLQGIWYQDELPKNELPKSEQPRTMHVTIALRSARYDLIDFEKACDDAKIWVSEMFLMNFWIKKKKESGRENEREKW